MFKMNSYIWHTPTVNVGDTIEYYAPESVVGDHFNICKGTVSTILRCDSLQEMIDVHACLR